MSLHPDTPKLVERVVELVMNSVEPYADWEVLLLLGMEDLDREWTAGVEADAIISYAMRVCEGAKRAARGEPKFEPGQRCVVVRSKVSTAVEDQICVHNFAVGAIVEINFSDGSDRYDVRWVGGTENYHRPLCGEPVRVEEQIVYAKDLELAF